MLRRTSGALFIAGALTLAGAVQTPAPFPCVGAPPAQAGLPL